MTDYISCLAAAALWAGVTVDLPPRGEATVLVTETAGSDLSILLGAPVIVKGDKAALNLPHDFPERAGGGKIELTLMRSGPKSDKSVHVVFEAGAFGKNGLYRFMTRKITERKGRPPEEKIAMDYVVHKSEPHNRHFVIAVQRAFDCAAADRLQAKKDFPERQDTPMPALPGLRGAQPF